MTRVRLLSMAGIVLFFAGLIAGVLFMRFKLEEQPKTHVFSSYTLLSSSWQRYKARFIQQDGRVIDFSDNDITTSEGQSYGLLRAVWSDDRETFDRIYTWTKENLQHKNDRLFSWRWGRRSDGTWGVSEEGGQNNASDADIDIALALILASRRWGHEPYLNDARAIVGDIWNYSTVEIQGKRYLTAGNWAHTSTEAILNPSYFAPSAFRIFARVDPDHDWIQLIDTSYDVLHESSILPLDRTKAVGLPPNWVQIKRDSGQLQAPTLEHLTTEYSFDAMRVPWRVAIDYHWFEEPRAKAYLTSMITKLKEAYEQEGRLVSTYAHDGQPVTDYENASMYATFLSGLTVTDPTFADRVYTEKILTLYSSDENGFLEAVPYYEQNWLWFGSALYLKQITAFGWEEA